MKKFLLSLLAATSLCLTAQAAVTIQSAEGWFESGCVTWLPINGATNYNVYVKAASAANWTQLDKELVRQYPGYYRADALGLKAGDYSFKVVPVNGNGEMTSEATVSQSFTATAHDRSGFAHVGMTDGIGAYKNDGTLKDGAKVLYVWADNAKTVTHTMTVDSKGNTDTRTGLQNIIQAYEKGVHSTPLAIRIIGTIKGADMDAFGSSAEGLQVKGKEGTQIANLTIEGVGDDAAIHGFGILCRSIASVEYRNFAIMYCLDDCLSLDTDNHHIWIHNMDLFYGRPGSAADQKKGDGTVDIKGKSSHVTVSYNHFFDSGKCSLGGMKSETTDCWMTYHHNWFDHSDSRHPRIRTAFYHVYNNFYDGNSKYGVGVTYGGSAFVENNYFRNCKYPFLISKQGTDAEGDGTFSGENGGVIKAYNNVLVNPRKVQYTTGDERGFKWDAVLVSSRDAAVSTACSTGTGYNSRADKAAREVVTKLDAPADVPTIVRGKLGAGRMQHGDFKWSFRNASQDENYAVINELSTTLQAYKSTLVGFASGTAISNGGAATTVNAGDGKDIATATNDASRPSWGSGTILTDGVVTSGGGNAGGDNGDGGEVSDPTTPTLVIGTNSDYFWFNEANAEAVNGYIADGNIALDADSKFKPAIEVKKSDGTVVSSHKGSLQLATGSGTVTFYWAEGINQMSFFLARTGSMTGEIQTSDDGVLFTKVQGYSTNANGSLELTVITGDKKYVRLTNAASGSLHVQGIKLYTSTADAGNGDSNDPTPDTPDLPDTDDGDDNSDPDEGGDDVNTPDPVLVMGSASDYFWFNQANAEAVNGYIDEGTILLGGGTAFKPTIEVKNSNGESFSPHTGSLQLDKETGTVTFYQPDGINSISLFMARAGNMDGKILTSDNGTDFEEEQVFSGQKGTKELTVYISNKKYVRVTNSSTSGTLHVQGIKLYKNATIDDEDGDEEDGEDNGGDGENSDLTETIICSFSSSDKQPSSDMVSVSGNYANNKGTVSYEGTDYKDCVKIETDTKITIKPTSDYDITLVFDLPSKRFKLDGKTYSTDANKQYTFAATAGTTYTLTKGDAMNLFLVIFTPKSDDVNNDNAVNVADVVTLVKQNKQTEAEALANKILEAE